MLLDSKIAELVAVGASVSANCRRCLRYHIEEARKAGASDTDILGAVNVGTAVRAGAAAQVDEIVASLQHQGTATAAVPAASCSAVTPKPKRDSCC